MFFVCLGAVATALLPRASAEDPTTPTHPLPKTYPLERSDAEWRKLLTKEQYEVLRAHGTERAFSGKLWDDHARAVFVCAACGNVLFRSETKFDSGTGWPSFWQPVDPTHIETVTDSSDGMVRSEVRCARCGGHLGHVFDDGPKPTGLRYCINSAALASLPPPGK